jgi:hypothetical protein
MRSAQDVNRMKKVTISVNIYASAGSQLTLISVEVAAGCDAISPCSDLRPQLPPAPRELCRIVAFEADFRSKRKTAVKM